MCMHKMVRTSEHEPLDRRSRQVVVVKARLNLSCVYPFSKLRIDVNETQTLRLIMLIVFKYERRIDI